MRCSRHRTSADRHHSRRQSLQNGNAEKLTTIEANGRSRRRGEWTRAQVTLRTEACEEIVVDAEPGRSYGCACARRREPVEGLYIGVPEDSGSSCGRASSHWAVNAEGTNVTVNEPLKLTVQDRLQNPRL